MKKFLRLSFFSVVVLLASTVSRADTLYLTSLEWPPYSGADLTSQGASVAVAKAALEAMGHELVVEFYPWSRAVALATDNDKYAGYFPEYFYESDDFLFSDPMGQGPLGFVEAVDNPVEWDSMADLTDDRIGVVQGYVNTAELDQMVADGEISAQAVTSDSLNVLKVAGGRIDMAVIDSNVLDYLLKNDPKVKSAVGKVQMNDKLLVEKDLYIAFKNNAEGKKWRDIFNEGLTKIDIESVMADHM
ncbi:transporter substrate-binding domain-containing protein [Marinobacter sp. CHS3-4]|uniref:substrate-binding periplasmic protein n=1 Tax=Marinobacter sp. CHS3-4 TaxID=3045174 RepID=UPI0024B5600A|nr:transporter substrate-binding domain-containing protein [Marinobacter sp. CHS3-4]MDI9246363.1 transporter substrate-binding domain-containing protein [Marinobacter sp. CHS3-4]